VTGTFFSANAIPSSSAHPIGRSLCGDGSDEPDGDNGAGDRQGSELPHSKLRAITSRDSKPCAASPGGWPSLIEHKKG
jgi:hypothetical protein